MQINTKIQIVMDQSDIEAAILAALYEKMPHLKGTDLSIKLIGGRGDAGHRAEIEGVQEATEAVTSADAAPARRVTDTTPAVEVITRTGDAEETNDDTAPFPTEDADDKAPAAEEPPQEPRGIFRKSATPAATTTPAEEAASGEPAPVKSTGIFSKMTRPDNRSN